MLLETHIKFSPSSEGNGNESIGFTFGHLNGSLSGLPDGHYLPAMLTEGLSPRKRSTSYTLPTPGKNNDLLMDHNAPRGSAPKSQSITSPGSSSDSKSPSSSIPTCIVAPTAAEQGYDSTEENSQMNKFIPTRKQREFIPESKKDDGYWEKRRKNNEAARRSREKRRFQDMALENRIMDLTRDNCKLRNELAKLKARFGIPPNEPVLSDDEDSMSSTPRTMPLNLSPPSAINPNIIASHGILSSALQNRSSSLPQSQASRIPSGSLPMPYPNPYASSVPQGYPPNIKSQGSNLENHVESQPSGNPFFAHSDSHNGRLVSMKEKEDPILGIRPAVEDHGKPVFPSVVPSSQVNSYDNIMATGTRAPSNYWVPATDITSSDSNDDYEWGDQVQNEPLSLVKKTTTENSSGSDASHTSSRASNSPPSMALPHKLRHKVPHDNAQSLFPYVQGTHRFTNGLAVLSKMALEQGNALPSVASDDSLVNSSYEGYSPRPRFSSNPRGMYDNKYVERRRKNNEAARKCRENRKALTRLREVKSGYLEHENDKLKDELSELQKEMNQLKEMLDKKKQKLDMEMKTDNMEEELTAMDDGHSPQPRQEQSEEDHGDSPPVKQEMD